MLITLESVPGIKLNWALTVKQIAQGNNWRLWRRSNSNWCLSVTNYHESTNYKKDAIPTAPCHSYIRLNLGMKMVWKKRGHSTVIVRFILIQSRKKLIITDKMTSFFNHLIKLFYILFKDHINGHDICARTVQSQHPHVTLLLFYGLTFLFSC